MTFAAVLVVSIFSVSGVYGAYVLLFPLFGRISRENITEHHKKIMCAASSLLILLCFALSLVHIVNNKSDKASAEAYSAGYAEGEAVMKTEPEASENGYDDGFDDGYLDGYSDGFDNALDKLTPVMESVAESISSIGTAISASNASFSSPVPATADKILSETVVPETDSKETTQKDDFSPEGKSPAAEKTGGAETQPEKKPISGTVYYTANGEVYHASKSCSYLKRASTILEGDLSTLSGRRPCSRCVK